MSHISHISPIIPIRRIATIALLLLLLLALPVRSQITIGGNVYGGGNEGIVTGNTTVNVRAGDLNSVYGGARMADVGGSAFVNIDGDHASDYILINYVYGGNDISGIIGSGSTPPTELTKTTENNIDNTWNAFVRISSNYKNSTYYTQEEIDAAQPGDPAYGKTTSDVKTAGTGEKIYIGQLFGGGNGSYTYTERTITGENGQQQTEKDDYGNIKYDVTLTDNTTTIDNVTKPEVGKTYLEILGGSIVYAYGGGNNVTVKENTVICLDNESDVVNEILDDNGDDLITKDNRVKEKMGINTIYSYPSSDQYQIGSFFGGNNMAPMAIRPTWNLQQGKIRNLYSGGNRGKMTSPDGLLLDINPPADKKDKLIVENVYGGCRMADVHPANYPTVGSVNFDGNDRKYYFPDGFSARLLIQGGHITNVYGGNDITGKVYGGNAVGIHTTIYGDIYGGGNGSYPYTNNTNVTDKQIYGDLIFTSPDPNDPFKTIEALNDYRPNAEQVSVHVWGTEANPTIIRGSLYLGGNSATVKTTKANPKVELKIGSHVIANTVFLGNNGAEMVKYIDEDKDNYIHEGVLKTLRREDLTTTGEKFCTAIDLTEADQFEAYMEGAAMTVMPSVVFDGASDRNGIYTAHSSYFGSFYCGGNRGSIKKDKAAEEINFNHEVVIFDKLVGGCNNAIVELSEYNARYEGGIIGSPEQNTGNKVKLDLSGLKVEPRRWKAAVAASGDFPNRHLEWNTIGADGTPTDAVTTLTPDAGQTYQATTDADLNRRFTGGNIYGGCYTSGIVNGNVVINIDGTLIDRDMLFDKVESDKLGEEISLYGDDQTTTTTYHITERKTGVILGQQGMDVLGKALNVFGGGKGKATEVWGSTTINLNKGYTFQIFGGSEEGVIGKPDDGSSTAQLTFNGSTYRYNPKYSCIVNLRGNFDGVSKSAPSQSPDMAEAEFIYGGGFLGPIAGNTIINLGKGRIFNSFAGSCNADILGHTETYIGRQVNADGTYDEGFPWIRDIVYGGNDLGGEVYSEASFKDRLRTPTADDEFDVAGKVYNPGNKAVADVLNASAYVEYLQGRAMAIFGGCYGTYDYTDRKFKDYTDIYGTPLTNADGTPKFKKPTMNSAFVNFRPTYVNANNMVEEIYGAGQGMTFGVAYDTDRDKMQNRSYVLIDIPQEKKKETTGDSGDSGSSVPGGSPAGGGTGESQVSTSFSDNFRNLQVFGAGSWCGLGMGVPAQKKDTPDGTSVEEDPDNATAIIDLVRGDIGAAYGGSYKEGVTRRSLVNVPQGSTINIGSIFAGAYGEKTIYPCDVYEANVEYHSSDAVLVCNPQRTDAKGNTIGNLLQKGAIYGGNNRERRTIYGKIHIDVPVRQQHHQYGMTTATVYGAGYGPSTWSEYTEVVLDDGADVYEAYGGGEQGRVLCAESVQAYMNMYKNDKPATIIESDYHEEVDWNTWSDIIWPNAWKIGGGLDPASFDEYYSNAKTNLTNTAQVRRAEVDNRKSKTYTYNTNVIINKGANVGNYAYGGGLGKDGVAGSGDVYGSTYIALLGGTVAKDIYAAGTIGAVYDAFGVNGTIDANNPFVASANAYIEGGTLRNVYGGGWKGDVGYAHYNTVDVLDENNQPVLDEDGNQVTKQEPDPAKDVLGETNVVIGIRSDQAGFDASDTERFPNGYGFLKGIPAIQRNAYSGGEGGAVFGTANLVLNNGYIGYAFTNTKPEEGTLPYYTDGGGYYQEKVDDETYYETINNEKVWKGKDRLKDCGNLFGGGYDVRSSVDFTNIKMYGGVVRNSMHGGGEIATVGRGESMESGEANATRTLKAIHKDGGTHIEMYNGHVRRNVFGGGKGYNIFGYGQQGTLYTDGYVFGKTEVYIYGGEVGTKEGMAEGYGNVFGGGDIGYVYGRGFFNNASRKTVTGSPGHYYYYSNNYKCNTAYGNYKQDQVISEVAYSKLPASERGNWTAQELTLTEDCKVVIAPELQVKPGGSSITFNGTTYNEYDYVPTDYLNTLAGKDKTTKQWAAAWNNLVTTNADGSERGILIHNGVFGGGNVSSNSDTHYANATTVYGNTTATLYDIFHRDFITIGTEHTGGIYGGGNLSLVHGYRELNITNYGTDYYGLESQITLDEYKTLSNRERAYFQLQYVCKGSITLDEHYDEGQVVKEEDYLKLVEKYGDTAVNAFTPYGFCSIYAGRLLNTIQRADFCGVFGSRMVLQGAKDRVAEIGEDIEYTINRVGELSLNKQRSQVPGVEEDERNDDYIHGNYFGIYSLVNYMGNLTSDVKFGENRIYKEKGGTTELVDNADTYYSFKSQRYGSGAPKSDRNNGCSKNQVALASGVFLELTTENSTETHKDYGYITGVVELDLINVKKDMVGGGFVYAKNEHRVPKYFPNKHNVLLSDYNHKNGDIARTVKMYSYTKDDEPTSTDETNGAYVISGDDINLYQTMPYQTSGNFIHPSKTIVDDCYPTNNAYIIGSANYSEGHYWYVKGAVYIYDQKLSAYTGSANAYSKEVHLPLTITAASHGRLQLLNVKPNLYAYYTKDANGNKVKIGSNDINGKPLEEVWVNNDNESYTLNQVVTWWDWQQMSYADRQFFVTETFVNSVPCLIDGTEYAAGTYIMDQTDFNAFKAANHTIKDTDGSAFLDDDNKDIGLTYVFRPSNNISHDSGYLLTFDMNSPDIWNNYYTKVESANPTADKIRQSEYLRRLNAATDDEKQTIINTWREGPTFTPVESGVYGQRAIQVGEIITKEANDNNATTGDDAATVEAAYVATTAVTYDYTYAEKYLDSNNQEQTRQVTVHKTTHEGTGIPVSEYNAISAEAKAAFAPAYLCTQTVKLNETNYLLNGELKSKAQLDKMKQDFPKVATDIASATTEAFICSKDGYFGGRKLDTGTNYNALTTWCALPKSDRIDNTTGEDKFTFNYDALDLLSNSSYLVVDASATKIENPEHSVTVDAFHSPYTDIVGVEYKAVFKATTEKPTYTYSGGTLNNGDAIDQDVFEREVLNDKSHYTRVSVAAGGETIYFATQNFVYNGVPYGRGQAVDENVFTNNPSMVEDVFIPNTSGATAIRYYCYEDYTSVDGDEVKRGTKANPYTISETDFTNNLKNNQQYFVIQGQEPTETTTLYVSSESDIKDVSSERVYTVVYQYTYYEDQDDGSVSLTNELHVVNVHVVLESGAPSIGTLNPPATVLPSNAIGLTAPSVKPGLYEVLTNGWELYSTEDDAIHHRNGAPFTNNTTPVFWYQNQKNFIAFYSKTYLGKTYSNYVPISVANYHDLDDVMKDKEHHMYVDRSDVDRPSKIYIDDRECESDPDKSELDLLKDFFDLSVLSGAPAVGSALEGHAPLDNHVHGTRNLEFFLRSDVSPKAYSPTATSGGSGSGSGSGGDTGGDTGGGSVSGGSPAGWVPIGNDNDNECFEGILHGDGYTISGLDHSLFKHLCGEVYNLGVTGSFTSAGIADNGYGYLENCWVASDDNTSKTDKAVFNNPANKTNLAEGETARTIHMVNCYYPQENKYTAHDAAVTYGKPTEKPLQAFHNGEVAYNLNSFYLFKRYCDNKQGLTDNSYYFLKDVDGELTRTKGFYEDNSKIAGRTGPYLLDNYDGNYVGSYVENRFADGDFVYAGGTIPESSDIRLTTVTEDEGENATTKTYFHPIWPDDYIFFGQMLNYGYNKDYDYQAMPSRINKENSRTLLTEGSNRVYRAPAYFRDNVMKSAYYNTDAYFAKCKADDPAFLVHKGMTAIDFTGYNDDTWAYGTVPATSGSGSGNGSGSGSGNGSGNGSGSSVPGGLPAGELFFPPLLDNIDGLTKFTSAVPKATDQYPSLNDEHLTRNLLVYTKSDDEADVKTTNAVSTTLVAEAYKETDTDYHTVNESDDWYSHKIKGHWVLLSGNSYTATRDHMLVDKQDFYCPIEYKFNDDSRMWYQRKPDNFVGRENGWEGISLPFAAQMVTTNKKGELTHFYKGSLKGHEYWLREYRKMDVSDDEATAAMYYPDKGSNTKEYTNTFLWDYYYSKDDFLDKNTDEYHKDYYSETHTYSDYPYSVAGTPYIMGLPGEVYYEFDLSGTWTPSNRYEDLTIASPGRQIITLASEPGETIGTSYKELNDGEAAYNGYTFRPNYLNEVYETGTANANIYLLNSEGSGYVAVPATGDAVSLPPFRPFFVKTATSRKKPTRISFSKEYSSLDNDMDNDATGSLSIKARHNKIVVKSNLSATASLRILSVSGLCIANFTIEPGQVVETPITNAGVYIVRSDDGRHVKKLAVE